MATIQFENGQEVEFDGEPTQADVEEVANSLGIGNPQAEMTQKLNKVIIAKEKQGEDVSRLKQTMTDLSFQGVKGRYSNLDTSSFPAMVGDFAQRTAQGVRNAPGIKQLADVSDWAIGGALNAAGNFAKNQIITPMVQSLDVSREIGTGKKGAVSGALNNFANNVSEGMGSVSDAYTNIVPESARKLVKGVGSAAMDLGSIAGGAELTGLAKTVGKAGVSKAKTLMSPVGTEKNLTEFTQKALSPRGAKTGAQIQSVTNSQNEGIKLLERKAPNIMVKDADGIDTVFNPKKATFAETIQAHAKAKDDVFKTYAKELKKASDTGNKVKYQPTIDYLKNEMTKGIDLDTKQTATKLYNDFMDFRQSHGNDPSKLSEYIQKKNSDLAAKYKAGTVDNVTAKATELMRDGLDEMVGRTAYGKEYGALKSIEKDLAREAQRMARLNGSGLEGFADAFGNIDLVMAAITGNPVQAAKGLATKGFMKMLRISKSPETMLKKAFQTAGKINTAKGK